MFVWPRKVHAAHPAGLIEMREGPLQALAAKPQQTQATRTTNASTIAIDRSARLGPLIPVASSAIGFRDVAPDAHGFEIDERLTAVIPLVAHHFFEALAVGPHRLDALGRVDQRLAAGGRVALVGVLDGHPDDRSALEIDGMLGLVRQIRLPVLHLRDLRVGIVRMGPVIVRPFLFPLAVDARQFGARRRLNPRGLRELRQEVLIALTRVAPHDAAQRRVRLERRRVDADRLSLHQARVGQSLQHPGEDRLVRLEIDQAPRARNGRMIGRRLRQHHAEKLAQGKRIGRPPRDGALGVQAFEVADQQQSEVAARRQPWSAVVRVEPLAEPFDVGVEVVLVENLIQSRVERMGGTARQVLGRHPHRALLRVPPSFAHRHRRQCSTRDPACRSRLST